MARTPPYLRPSEHKRDYSGRPPKMKGGGSYSVYLDEHTAKVADNLGNGNMSKGLQIMGASYNLKEDE